MANRTNVDKNLMIDAFGNLTTAIGTALQPSNKLMKKEDFEKLSKEVDKTIGSANVGSSGIGKHRAAAMEKIKTMTPMPDLPKNDAEFDVAGAISGATNIAKSFSGVATGGTMSNADKTMLGAGIGAGGNAAGNFLSNSGNEVLGGALSGASTGASLGTKIAPGIGTAIGAGVGLLFGGLKGAQDKKAKEEFEEDYNKTKDEINEKLKKEKKMLLGQADDLDSYDALQAQANKLANFGKRKNFVNMNKTGGILRYKPVLKKEEKETKVEEKQKTIQDVSMYKHGGKMPKNAREKQIIGAKTERVFKNKKGAKVMSCKKGCDCKKCKKSSTSIALIFRRGGKVNLSKGNVIIDGPSHDEFNNTGVKGDKGLPVGKINAGGKLEKIAEIESGELVINAVSSKQIEELRNKAKKGDQQAVEMLAELLMKELDHNTHDYSNLMD